MPHARRYLEQNVQALSVQLSPAELKQLEAICPADKVRTRQQRCALLSSAQLCHVPERHETHTLLLLLLRTQVVGERYPDMKKFSYHYARFNRPLSATDL